jgi:hypothetical protein
MNKKISAKENRIIGYLIRLTPEQLAKLLGIEDPYEIDHIAYDEDAKKFYIKTKTYIHKDEYEEKKNMLLESHNKTLKFLQDQLNIKMLDENECKHFREDSYLT